MSNRDILSNYVYQVVAALIQNGVEDVVISPGSRSTPLAYAFASTKSIQIYRQVDERSAAFFALGIAKAKGKPVALLCTSGTAAANYFPAIVEAKNARVPLIVITADRPHELREVGAPQTINQIRLYGEQVKWSIEFPLPDGELQTRSFIERHIARAINISKTAPFGPVHMNVPFREPLLINFQETLPKPTFQRSIIGEISASDEAKTLLAKIMSETKRGFIVVGELSLGTDLQVMWDFIRKVKWPVLVESLSNLRTNIPSDCREYIISSYDALLKSESFKEKVIAETVIRFGAQPVSKFLTIFLTKWVPANYVVVDEDPMFRDSASVSSHFLHASIGNWLRELDIQSALDPDYLDTWRISEEVAVKYVQSYIDHEEDEGAMVRTIIEQLPDESDLFVSSSMPIRDIDTFLIPTEKDIQIIANRGANGIDGVVSTALGYSSGRADRNSYLLIGDLAFLHDINGLIATRYQPCEMTIIVFNNDGGGIFSYLSQATVKEYYEDLFGTPTALQFEHIAKMYDMEYIKVNKLSEMKSSLNRQSGNPLKLIEVFTNRQENVIAHRKLWSDINKEIEAL